MHVGQSRVYWISLKFGWYMSLIWLLDRRIWDSARLIKALNDRRTRYTVSYFMRKKLDSESELMFK